MSNRQNEHTILSDTFLKRHLTGFLVPKFLQSGLTGSEFLRSLGQSANQHADFLMVAMDVL